MVRWIALEVHLMAFDCFVSFGIFQEVIIAYREKKLDFVWENGANYITSNWIWVYINFSFQFQMSGLKKRDIKQVIVAISIPTLISDLGAKSFSSLNLNTFISPLPVSLEGP